MIEVPVELGFNASQVRDALGRWATSGSAAASEGVKKGAEIIKEGGKLVGEAAEKLRDTHERLQAADTAGAFVAEQGFAHETYHRLKGLLEKAEHHATALGMKTWDHIPTAVQKVLAPLYHAYTVVDHQIDKVSKVGLVVATQIMSERSIDPIKAARLAHVLHVVDKVVRYTVAEPVAKAVTHLGGPAGFLVGETAKAIPLASLAYIGYSTARNPLAVIRAARKTIKPLSTGEIVLSLSNDLKPAFDFDRYLALLCAALDQTGDAKKAKALADKVYDMKQGDQ